MEIKIKIVLLMAKVESVIVVKRKRQNDFGKNTSTEYGIRTRFERFCESGSVENRSRSGGPTGINQEKVDVVDDFLQTHPGSNVRSVTGVPSILHTTTYRIRTEHL